jgi:hypothetical protein
LTRRPGVSIDFVPRLVHGGTAITMSFHANSVKSVLLAAALVFSCFGIRSDGLPHPASRMDGLPQVTLWAWERRENFSSLDTTRYAVAYLDRTVTIGLAVESQPRRDPVVFPSAARRMPVVRIEAQAGAVLDEANRATVVRDLVAAAEEPGASALQIDFDAARSQREFYRQLLFDVRRQMSPGLPLSITALASWCSWDSWLRGLPVDEAVPMLFRMEPDRRRAAADIDDFRIREPLCMGSVGVSTTEPWPDDMRGKRIYIFADEGWRRTPLAELERRLP